jgi:hypothetical protein
MITQLTSALHQGGKLRQVADPLTRDLMLITAPKGI